LVGAFCLLGSIMTRPATSSHQADDSVSVGVAMESAVVIATPEGVVI
jgi:hypothetical protein